MDIAISYNTNELAAEETIIYDENSLECLFERMFNRSQIELINSPHVTRKGALVGRTKVII